MKTKSAIFLAALISCTAAVAQTQSTATGMATDTTPSPNTTMDKRSPVSQVPAPTDVQTGNANGSTASGVSDTAKTDSGAAASTHASDAKHKDAHDKAGKKKHDKATDAANPEPGKAGGNSALPAGTKTN